MDMVFETRQFYPDELKHLRSLKSKSEKRSGIKIKVYHYVIAGLLGAACTYTASTIPDSFWTFPLGTTAVFSFGFIVFIPYEIYKQRKAQKDCLQKINTFIDKCTVYTCIVHSKRIAVAEEYEDEGDLYIIEYDTDKLLYLWDSDYNMQKNFPCLDFEIYEDNFYKIYGRQVYSLSDRVNPLTIDKTAKWKHMSKVGVPRHLENGKQKLR